MTKTRGAECPAPFRWDVRQRCSLSRLLQGPRAPAYPGFEDDLLECCARLVAASFDGRLVFLGRSPESLFDHLTGLLDETTWSDRPTLVPLSLNGHIDDERAALLRAYLTKHGLAPGQLLRARRPVAICDVVCEGHTFGHLVDFLEDWAKADGLDWPAVRATLRFVCIETKKLSTWREAKWATDLRRATRAVRVPYRLWNYLADNQLKTAASFRPERWGDASVARPDRSGERLQALRLARYLLELGRTRLRRSELARRLVALDAMRETWFRGLVRQLA